MIHFKDFTFRFANQTQATLLIETLAIPQGECVVLCGASGSGKTCTTRVLNGLIPEFYEGEHSGEATLNQLQLGRVGTDVLAQHVSSVFQNPATQFFHRTVAHEMVFPCENLGVPEELMTQRLEDLSQQLQISHLLTRDLTKASGGERQRVAVATAFMQNPSIIVMDEPTANLDKAGVEQVRQLLTRLKKAGVTLVIAEHRLDFLKELADRYIYFENGQKRQEWNKVEWLSLSNSTRQAYGLRGLDNAGRSLALPDPNMPGLALTGLHLKTHQVNLGILENMTFPAGAITALVGENGIGKSTLARILSGLEEVDGDICYLGKKMPCQKRLQATSLVMQEVRLQLVASSVKEEICLGATNLENFDAVVERLRLKHLLDRHPMALSGGEQQRVLIASALLSEKQIYIFDEPTSGLDYQQMLAFSQLLQDLQKPDRVIIVITHDWELINQACDYLIPIQFQTS